eukprot:3670017-Pleurochrysis_carterae.AAC.1
MPAYKAKQLLGVAQVVGAFPLGVRVLCWSIGLAARSSRSGARMRMSCGFRLRSETSYKLSALRAVPWLAKQLTLGSVVVVVHD